MIRNKYIQWALIFVVGLGLGWLFFSHSSQNYPVAAQKSESAKQIWTCSMHPQIRQDHPGKCPLCGMDLIPLQQNNEAQNPAVITLSEDAVQTANIQTSPVMKGAAAKEIRLYGRVENDERAVSVLPAHLPGRIDKLLINFTGDRVVQGQTIAIVYSPELVQAQQELLEAKKLNGSVPGALEAAREKLRQWKLTPAQINAVENGGRPVTEFEVKATTSGVVTKKMVNQGDYVSQGAALYEVTDLSRLWVLFDVYETDLPWIKAGDNLSYELQSMPGKEFSGRVSFVSPMVDSRSRTVKIRVEAPNRNALFKPGMLASGVLKAKLKGNASDLIVPRSAVLWTGTRSVVYVKVPNAATPSFEMRNVTLGTDLGESIIVTAGLHEGENVVTNGVFSVDAAAQLAGKPSMMNHPETAPVVAGEKTAKKTNMQHKKIVYVCPMKEDADIVLDHPGKCPKCGMNLVKKEL
ncbi:efflux RND transporter periplasmic adaptor subunit [Paludibacter sp.]|uniref:efflux RND transporter periplasmic adaptor subunit n=1 Tax=Paludibacter sp. TaxID=1898105 RepID=UPI001353C02D|nr:efflux RND transporter periplasmic adaptor subunit [Paludibacter sp.]MTK54554.1 efflux RND transporter periplasmic adaptor subunit [Paludibacter sp.]